MAFLVNQAASSSTPMSSGTSTPRLGGASASSSAANLTSLLNSSTSEDVQAQAKELIKVKVISSIKELQRLLLLQYDDEDYKTIRGDTQHSIQV